MPRTKIKEKNDLIKEIIEAEVKDKELIIKASKTIDALRNRYARPTKALDSTELIRKIREVKIK